MPFDLPDGQQIQIFGEASKAAESIFDPMKLGSTEMGVAHMVSECAFKVDAENRKELLSHIVLAGGNTLYKNFSTRYHNII